MSDTRKRILSGMQPTGALHLGNYLGALQNWIKLSKVHDCFFCIVDYHALTNAYEVKELEQRIMDVAIDYLACGLDPDECSIFIQSHVPQVTELEWMLVCVTPMGELERMTQYKDKSRKQVENINAGLFCYPVLQTADIIIYDANLVPVGEDQVQHIELAREIVRNFNRRFGEVFIEPEAYVTSSARIRGLDGKAKMSKSLNNHISLRDTPEQLQKKLMRAVTDENRKRRSDPGNPDICNIYTLHKHFTLPETIDSINQDCRNAGIGCVDCKKILLKNLNSFLEPIQQKQNQLINDTDFVKDVLRAGAERAEKSAKSKIQQVRKALGFIQPF